VVWTRIGWIAHGSGSDRVRNNEVKNMAWSMANMARFMRVCGALSGGRGEPQWFKLPGGRRGWWEGKLSRSGAEPPPERVSTKGFYRRSSSNARGTASHAPAGAGQ
jgi:hypothetical protein